MPNVKVTKVTEKIPGGLTYYDFVTYNLKKDEFDIDRSMPSDPERYTVETLTKIRDEAQAKLDLINQQGA